jgi:CHAT domain
VLYPEDVEGKAVDEKKFWAFSKNMQLLHEGLAHGVELDPPWHLAAAVDKNDKNLEAGALVHEEASHPFVTLAKRIKKSELPHELFEAFAQAEMLYHYGHASSSSRGFEFGEIQVNGVKLDAAGLETLLNTSIELPDREPLLVFLNGCSTDIGAGDGETIPEVLVRHGLGRLCFVTTLGAVPPWAAAMFAQHFFCAYLGDGRKTQSLGESLAHARREMLEKHGNPVGVLYVAYGNTATAIKSSTTAAGPT